MGSIGKKRQKATVQVQNRYSGSARVTPIQNGIPLNERNLKVAGPWQQAIKSPKKMPMWRSPQAAEPVDLDGSIPN